MTSIEAMQRHFILVIHGFKAPVGEYYSAVESRPRASWAGISSPTARTTPTGLAAAPPPS